MIEHDGGPATAPGTRTSGGAGRARYGGLVLLGAASGALTGLAHAPWSVWPAALVGMVLALWVFRRAGGFLRGAGTGFAWGIAFGAVTMRWLLALDPFAFGLVPVLSVYWAVAAGLVARFSGRLADGRWVWASAAAWTAVEAVRGRWPLSGFEWGQLGWATADLPLRHAAAVVGSLGVTALVVAVAGAVVVAAEDRRSLRPLAGTVGAAVVLGLVGAVGWTSPSGSIDVGIVQIDDPCPGSFAVDCPDFGQAQLDRFVAGTRSLEGTYDILLWGEGTLRAPTAEETGDVVAESIELPAPLASGVANRAGPGRFYQRNILFDTDGGVLAVYSKRVPVPFGEYVPWREVLGGIADVGRLVPTDLVPGDGPVALPLPVDGEVVDLGTVVSWEVTFSRLVRDAAGVGEAVVTLTTQGSYGPRQPVSDQLIAAARMRAAETGKAIAIAATTGRSVIVLPGGALASEPTALYGADTLEGTLPLRTGSTPFARWGDAPVALLAAVGTVVATVRTTSRRWGSAAHRDSEADSMPSAG